MIRNRKSKLSAIQELDAFPKVPDTYVSSSFSGGTVSVICMIGIITLVYSEITDFLNSGVNFKFSPDGRLDERVELDIDMTVAMPCRLIGADVLDSTGQSVVSFGQLNEEDTWFELSPNQKVHFLAAQRLNARLREESHSLQQLLWKSGYQRLFGEMPARNRIPDTPRDACRLYGRLQLNKVAGNFHVTGGKVLPLPLRAHAHIAPFLDDEHFNYSHRIEKFSFGPPAAGLVHPLEGDEVTTNQGAMLYQYFISVVPTEIESLASASSGIHSSLKTFQYSVRNQSRPVSHQSGSHGIPGIYFKYDFAPLRVRVIPDTLPFWQFVLRLCALVGGIYTTSGILHGLMESSFWLVCCSWSSLRSSTKQNYVSFFGWRRSLPT